MLIHLSELFNCEGRKKVYTVETALDSVDFDGETFQIEKAEPFELELTAKTRHKYTMSGHATLTVGGHCARCLEPVSFDCELDFGREFEVQDGQEESLDDEPFMKGYNLDVDQLVCNELLLSLPMKVLCREDCKAIIKMTVVRKIRICCELMVTPPNVQFRMTKAVGKAFT